MAILVLIGLIIFVYALIVAGIQEGAWIFLVIAGAIIYGVVKSISNASKDNQEGVIRLTNRKAFEDHAKARMAIHQKHGFPNIPTDPGYDTYWKEINELNSRTTYQKRKD